MASSTISAPKEFNHGGNLPVQSTEAITRGDNADYSHEVFESLRRPPPKIVEGDWVRLSGLSTSELNGEFGVVCSAKNLTAGRLAVELESGRQLSIKEENLVKVTRSEVEACRKQTPSRTSCGSSGAASGWHMPVFVETCDFDDKSVDDEGDEWLSDDDQVDEDFDDSDVSDGY